MSQALHDLRAFVDLLEARSMACDGPVTPFMEELNAASAVEQERFIGILKMLYSGEAEPTSADITAVQYLWIEKQRRDRRQLAMMEWVDRTFGQIEGLDTRAPDERARRFLEEAIELCQAVGMARAEAAKILDYVYGREPGKPFQEFGGTATTLNLLAEAMGTSLCAAELAEWDRIQSKSKAHFEARHRAKMEVGI